MNNPQCQKQTSKKTGVEMIVYLMNRLANLKCNCTKQIKENQMQNLYTAKHLQRLQRQTRENDCGLNESIAFLNQIERKTIGKFKKH